MNEFIGKEYKVKENLYVKGIFNITPIGCNYEPQYATENILTLKKYLKEDYNGFCEWKIQLYKEIK